jgi:hypothetical protein
MNVYGEVERHYTDLIRFQALQIAVDENWSAIQPPTSEDELAHLERYVRRFKDTRFKDRMKAAIREDRTHQANTAEEKPQYETGAFTVRRVPHFAEVRYGVHFKDTDEFGLYTVFYGDREDSYIGIYRSDASFDKEIGLDDLLMDEPV